jgi:subtilisin family serine protease
MSWQFLTIDSGGAKAEPLNIVWRSKATSSDSLTLDFASLYGALGRLYSLGVRFSTKEVNPAGRSIQQVLLDENQYVGSFLAPEVPRLLCGLNATNCSISQQSGEPKWTRADNDPLIIPALNFGMLWTPEYYNAKKGDTIEGIVLRDRRGCETLDSRCKDILHSLNPGKGDIVESPSGRIVVPTRNYFTEVKLQGVDLPLVSDDSGEAIKELKDLQLSPNESTKRRAEAVFSAVKPMIPNIVAVSGARPNASTNTIASPNPGPPTAPAYEAARARRQSIFKLVGGDWDPTLGGPYLWVNVALIDSRIDAKHCDFYPDQVHLSITPLGSTFRPQEEETRGECGLVLVPKPNLAVHGTHVAGIIAAKVGAKIGAGVFPFTKIYSYELDLGNAKTFLQSAAALLEQVLLDQVKVLNISSKYVKTLDASTDPFEEMMLRTGAVTQQMLLVAAAGNDSLSIGVDQDCPPRPACYNKYRNVISVIAIDDHPTTPAPAVFAKEISNSGEHFDIAAPGVRVPSTAPLNQIAELDGTSQAAPIVSGAAAHLYALRPASPPGEIKNRLIWTSDLLPSLYKKVFGGRINISAAVNDLDRDLFRLSGGATVKGNIFQKDRYVLNVRANDAEDSETISLTRVRRMLKRQDGSWDMLWLKSKAGDKDGPLLRKQVKLQWVKYKDDDAERIYLSDTIAIKTTDNTDVGIFLASKVDDFISSMK